MALRMDPARRRRLQDLARVHARWQAEHGIDDAEFTPDGADSAHRRGPSPEAERELMVRSRVAMGLDPVTGHYPD